MRAKREKKRYKEPEVCRKYKNGDSRIYLPILEWTEEDVANFVAERGIKCHPLYYDEQGNFHSDRRLGCIGCPLRSDNGKSGYKKYPKMLKQLIKSADIWINAPHKRSTSKKKFSNAYNLVFNNLFCSSYDEFQLLTSGGLFPETGIDAKSFMEEYFNIDLTI